METSTDTQKTPILPYIERIYNYFTLIFEYSNRHVQICYYPNIAFNELHGHKKTDKYFDVRDTIYFTDNTVCIVRPNDYKNWTLAMVSKHDIPEIIDQILGGET